MKKNSIVIALLIVFLLSGCYSSNQILAKKMLNMYYDDQSYITLQGEIIEYNNNFVTIKCEELNVYIDYEDEICNYHIHSDLVLDLSVGETVTFITVPFHFYNGHNLPIVEIVVNDEVLLSFNDGKVNLIDWVKTTFK